MPAKTLNVLSLFSGIQVGGLELGLERAGMTVVGQVEIDPFCRRVLERHWPDVPRHDDVRTAVAWWLGGARPAVDVVAGGFPCQPVSVAGKRRAQADERWLWPAAWAVIRDLRPRFAILENVPGLLSRGMGDVLGDLAKIGYDAEWDCVPAAAVGAPHRRDRVFVVAYPGHLRGGRPVRQRTPGRQESAGDGGGRDVADPDSLGLDRRRGALVGDAEHADDLGPRARWGTPATDPWWASEPGVCRMADGVPEGLDGVGLDADATEGRSRDGVRLLWESPSSAAAAERATGGSRRVPSTEVLRSPLHGAGAAQHRSFDDLPASVFEGCLRVVWDDRADRDSPHGRGSDEQLLRELADAVSSLSREVALAERQTTLAEAQSYVHRLRQACEAIGAVRNPSQPVAEAWLALPRQAQGWVRLAACGGPWVAEWPDTPRVAAGIPDRVSRLRALGNAVVPQVGEHIGRLVMAVAS